MNRPLVSVIIPVYNGERYLAEAIESVLSQTYRPIEVIVVDDGSTDDSADVAQRYVPPVRYYYQSNSGLGATQNKGINLAEGSLFAFLDADDVWVADKLTRQTSDFNANSKLDMVFGHVSQFHCPELDEHLKTKLGHDGEIMPGYSTGTMLIKRDSFFRVGLFETGWQVGDFVDWYAKAIERGLKGFMLPEVVMRRRIHGNNMGIRERKHQTDYVHILKASLDRRRESVNRDTRNNHKF